MEMCVFLCVRAHTYIFLHYARQILSALGAAAFSYGVATLSRFLEMIGLFCKRAL